MFARTLTKSSTARNIASHLPTWTSGLRTKLATAATTTTGSATTSTISTSTASSILKNSTNGATKQAMSTSSTTEQTVFASAAAAVAALNGSTSLSANISNSNNTNRIRRPTLERTAVHVDHPTLLGGDGNISSKVVLISTSPSHDLFVRRINDIVSSESLHTTWTTTTDSCSTLSTEHDITGDKSAEALPYVHGGDHSPAANYQNHFPQATYPGAVSTLKVGLACAIPEEDESSDDEGGHQVHSDCSPGILAARASNLPFMASNGNMDRKPEWRNIHSFIRHPSDSCPSILEETVTSV